MSTNKILDTFTDEHVFSDRTKKLLSIFFLVVAFTLSLYGYSGKQFLIFPKTIWIKPNMLGGIVAIAMLLPLYARGILIWRKTLYKLIVFVLLVCVFASIANIAIDGKSTISSQLVVAAIALSWLGMRSVAGLAWVLVFVAAAYNLVTVSQAMGFAGLIFVISAFLGLVFHADIAPDRLIREMLDEYSAKSSEFRNMVSDDVNSAGDFINKKMSGNSDTK